MRKLLSTIAIILIAFSYGKAQPQMEIKPGTGIIMGRITDANQAALQYVNVLLKKQSDGKVIDAVATDEKGMFVFKNVAFGTYSLDFKFLGFKNKILNNISVSKKNRFVKIGQVILDNDEKSIGQVVVQGQTSTVTYKLDKKVINVSKDLQAAGGDATDALRNVPSVDVDVNGDVTIRGSSNFTVMINGKPSILDPNEALKQIPVSNIEKIEIITNPSAKYDPDGDAGILNIITKHKSDNGLSGKIEIGADNNLGYNADVLLNYRKNKINFFTEFTLNKRIRPMKYSQSQQSFFKTDTFSIENTGTSSWQHSGMSGKAGLNYYINDKNTLSFSASYGKRSFGSNSQTNQHVWWSDNKSPEHYFLNSSGFNMNGTMLDADIDFEHKFDDKGQKIKFYTQYSYWLPNIENFNNYDTTNSNWVSLNNDPYMEKTNEVHNRKRLRFQVDYEWPINKKSKLQAGYSFRYLLSGGDYNVQTFDYKTNKWLDDPSQYNDMTLYRQIHAAYITFSSSTKWFDYELGLRTEYTDRLVTETVTNTKYPILRPDFFPTVHISKQLPFDQQIQASYSRRINRPRGWNLNPFPRYINQYTIRQGNPALAPEYTNSFELNYIKKLGRNSISLESYYKITEGKIDRIQSVDGPVTIYTAANLNKDYSLGGEISSNWLILKMLMLNVSANLYNYRLVGTVDGKPVDKQTMAWNTKFYIMTFLPTGTGIQFGGFYNAPTITAQGTRQAMFITFAGLRQSFLKRKLSLSIRVQDIFNTMNFAFTNETDNFYSINEFESIHPTIGFTLTYRIRNYKESRRNMKNKNSESLDFMGEGEY